MKSHVPGMAILLLVMLCIHGIAALETDSASDHCEVQFRRLERDIPSLYLMNGLFLTTEQYRELLPLVRKSAEMQSDIADKLQQITDRHQDDLARSFKRSRKRMSMGTGPRSNRKNGPEARRLRQAAREIAALRQRHDTQLQDLAHDVYRILTPAQQEVLDSFEPCFIPAQDFKNPVRVGQVKGDTSFGEKIFERLRQVPEERLPAARQRAVEQITDYIMHKSHMPYSDTRRGYVQHDVETRLDTILDEMRTLNDVDYELAKTDLVNQVVVISSSHPDPRDPTGVLSRIKAYLLNPGCEDVLARRAEAACISSPRAESLYSLHETLREYRDDRLTANLLMRLRLSSGQAGEILPVVQQGLDARRSIENKYIGQMCDAIPEYEKLRSALAAQSPSQDIENRANHCHHSVKKLREEAYVETIHAYEKEIDRMLTAEQIELLTARRSTSSRTPVAPGGEIEEERKEALRMLDRARRMHTTVFELEKTDLAVDYLETCLQNDEEYENTDLIAESDRITALLAQARTLDRPEYSRQRDNLALELCPRRRQARDPAYGRKYVRGKPLKELDKTTELLFSPTAVALLKELAD